MEGNIYSMNVDHADTSNSDEASPKLKLPRSSSNGSNIEMKNTARDDESSTTSSSTAKFQSNSERSKTVVVKGIVDTLSTPVAMDIGRQKSAKMIPKVGKRWTWKKPEGKPKRPLSAYNLFFASMRQSLLKEKSSSSGIGFSNLAKTVSEKWKALPDNDRSKFATEANALKETYMTEIKTWKKTNKVEEKIKKVEEKIQSKDNADSKLPHSFKVEGIHPVQDGCARVDDILNETMDTKSNDGAFTSDKGSRFNFKPDVAFSNKPDRVDYHLTETANIAIEMTELQRGIAVVTEAFTDLGKVIALKIASFPFVDVVLAISKAIPYSDFTMSNKIRPLAADISTLEGKHVVIEHVRLLCNVSPRRRQVRFLIHCPIAYGPTRSSLSIQHGELRHAMSLHCDAPLLLITSLYPYLEPDEDTGIAGRVLHILNHENKRSYGICVESLAYAALFQAYQDMTKEFQHVKGGNVIVGSCKVVTVVKTNEVVDDNVSLLNSSDRANDGSERSQVPGMLSAKNLSLSHDARANSSSNGTSNFVEHLLLGTSDKEFSNSGCPHLYTTEQERK